MTDKKGLGFASGAFFESTNNYSAMERATTDIGGSVT